MFQRARIKLTAWYLFIIMLISIAFSMVVYRLLTSEIDRFARVARLRIERRFRSEQFILPNPPPEIPQQPSIDITDPELVEDVKHRILVTLVTVNGVILILSGGFGYVLAGRTLKPIGDMVDSQNRFISDASHELRTPLTSLKSAMEVFLRGRHQTLKEAKDLISDSIADVDKLQTLSESLLTLAQYQQPDAHVNVKMGNVPIQPVISEAVKKIMPLARQKNVRIRTDAAAVSVRGNEYQLTDTLVILLDNAVKYSPPGSMIAVKAESADRFVTVSVTDKGIGIGENDLPHVFDRFYRTDSAREKEYAGGYGLGLAIAKKIVETHHGDITVVSALGKGSMFTVRLPRIG